MNTYKTGRQLLPQRQLQWQHRYCSVNIDNGQQLRHSSQTTQNNDQRRKGSGLEMKIVWTQRGKLDPNTKQNLNGSSTLRYSVNRLMRSHFQRSNIQAKCLTDLTFNPGYTFSRQREGLTTFFSATIMYRTRIKTTMTAIRLSSVTSL